MTRNNLPVISGQTIQYLSEEQINSLLKAFQDWYDSAPSIFQRKMRGRYWLTFLVARFTGARIGEVLEINDATDIDFRNAEIKLITLKKRNKNGKTPIRIIPVPGNITSETATYLAEHPDMKGTVFSLDQGNFRRIFYEHANSAKIPRDLAHPHILRHTRAIELLRAGIPVTLVQDMLGHASLNTTAVYLRISGQEAKSILKDKGMI